MGAPMSNLPVLPIDARSKDESLSQALSRMLSEHDRALRTAEDDPHVTAVRRLDAVEARYAPFPVSIDPRLAKALGSRGISQLYTHQAEAIGHALAGRNVVTITPTASGKTLCYNLPVMDAILKDPSTRALYLFPTKALAQDQLAELHQMAELVGAEGGGDIGVFTYNGDTPQDARRAIRGRAHVVLSNPDMVHSGILPHHPRWAKLFENLKFVIIDELHAYRGVFGSHLGNILRRLRSCLPSLWVVAHVHLFVCDDRESEGPCRTIDRRTVRVGAEERRATRREVLHLRESSGGECAARHQALVSG